MTTLYSSSQKRTRLFQETIGKKIIDTFTLNVGDAKLTAKVMDLIDTHTS